MLSGDNVRVAPLLRDVMAELGCGPADPDAVAARVEELSNRLPTSMQRSEVYGLLADVLAAAAELRAEYPQLAGAADVVGWLDEHVPHWQRRFPLDPGAGGVQALLSDLLATAVGSGAKDTDEPFRAHTVLVTAGESARVVRELVCADRVSISELAERFGVETGNSPRRFELVMSVDGAVKCRLATLTKLGDGQGYGVEQHQHQAAVAGTLELHLEAKGGRSPNSLELDGDHVLGPVPWVFSASGALLGTGVVSTEREPALVVLPWGTKHTVSQGRFDAQGRVEGLAEPGERRWGRL